jgi:hypothetical protein
MSSGVLMTNPSVFLTRGNRLWFVVLDNEMQGIYDRKTAARIASELGDRFPDSIIGLLRCDTQLQQPPEWFKDPL